MSDPSLTDAEREAEALADELFRLKYGRPEVPESFDQSRKSALGARDVLASDWLAARVAEAVDRERAAWVAKVTAFAAGWDCDDPGCDREGGAYIRLALLAADDTEAPTYREVVESLDPVYTSWAGRAADDTEGKP